MRLIALVLISAFLPFGLTLLALDAFHPAVSADTGPSGLVLGVSEPATPEAVLGALPGAAFLAEPGAGQSLPAASDKAVRAYRRPAAADFGPVAARAIVLDPADGQVLYESGADEERPVASLTKLAAALAFLKRAPDLEGSYTVRSADLVAGARQYLQAGDEVKKGDLLKLALVASANEAAQALAGAAGLAADEFVAEMNRTAAGLGLARTTFVDPTGLGLGNVSTAREVGLLVRAALAEPAVSEAVAQDRVEFRTGQGRAVSAKSTDALLGRYPRDGIELAGGKTGYTKAAGYCFAARFSRAGRDLVVAVLGEDDPGGRFDTAERLMEWAYGSYNWE